MFEILAFVIPISATLAGGRLATGPNDVVPGGAPLPTRHAPGAEEACDHLGVCAAICPSASSIFLADFAYDLGNQRFAVVDVNTPDGIFWMDASTCATERYGSFAGISQRGCGYDNRSGVVYVAGWNDQTIWRVDEEFAVLGSQTMGEAFAGLAVDEEGSRLFAATSGSPDELIEYTIGGDGSVSPTGRRWRIPWAGASDGHSTSSLEYDDASATFISINQDAATIEYFQLQSGDLVNTGQCALPLAFGWGFGLDFTAVQLAVADVAAFACNFPVALVEPNAAIIGATPPDLAIRYDPIASVAVEGFALPYGAQVDNNTDEALARNVWLELEAPRVYVDLGSFSFPPGTTQLNGSVGPLPMRPGSYTSRAHLSRSFAGTPEASAEIDFDIVAAGLQEQGPVHAPYAGSAALRGSKPSFATGPNDVVPEGAPLPASPPHTESTCDHLDICGAICPTPQSAFVADFAYDRANDRFAAVDVVSAGGVFWMAAESCVIDGYASFAQISQRGCAYDNDGETVYVAGWSDNTLYRLDAELNLTGSQTIAEPIAGLAVDEERDLLYASTNFDPDELIEYSIGEDGSVDPTGRRWPVPWGGYSETHSTASLEYDDCSGTFMMINQDANTMEYFQLREGDLVRKAHCALPLGYGWGFGLNSATVELEIVDVASFSCHFPIVRVEPDEAICGDGATPDFGATYEELASSFVGNDGGPMAVRVRNSTGRDATRVLWLSLAPNVDVPLSQATAFPPGTHVFNTGVLGTDLPVPAGEHSATINLGETIGGEADASVAVDFTIVAPGVQ